MFFYLKVKSSSKPKRPTCSMICWRIRTSSISQSYRARRHMRLQSHELLFHSPIWLIWEFFCSDIANSLGNIPFKIHVSHHLSSQNLTEFPFPTLRSIPSSTIVLTLTVSESLFIKEDHVPSLTFLNIFDEALAPLISWADWRIFFHRVLSDSENRHHHLNSRIRFLCVMFPTPRPPISLGSSISDQVNIGQLLFSLFVPPQKNLLYRFTIFIAIVFGILNILMK